MAHELLSQSRKLNKRGGGVPVRIADWKLKTNNNKYGDAY